MSEQTVKILHWMIFIKMRRYKTYHPISGTNSYTRKFAIENFEAESGRTWSQLEAAGYACKRIVIEIKP